MFLDCLSMKSGLRSIFKSSFPRIMRKYSMLQANDGLSCSRVSASKLSFANMAFWVGPRLSHAIVSLFLLSAVSCIRKWGYSLVSFSSFMRSMRALCFCTIESKSGED